MRQPIRREHHLLLNHPQITKDTAKQKGRGDHLSLFNISSEAFGARSVPRRHRSSGLLSDRFFQTRDRGRRALVRQHFEFRSIVQVIIHQKLFQFLQQILVEIID
jgi:hypothetical protein